MSTAYATRSTKTCIKCVETSKQIHQQLNAVATSVRERGLNGQLLTTGLSHVAKLDVFSSAKRIWLNQFQNTSFIVARISSLSTHRNNFTIALYVNCIFAAVLSLLSFNSLAGSCTPIPAGASAGQSLYCQNCASCHGEPPAIDGRASRAANNGSAVSSALNSVGAMQFLKGNFSTVQINSIASYIGNPVSGGGVVTPTFNAADLWWNPNESGWGLTVAQHANSNVIVLVIYTYMPTGQPLWLISSGSWTTPTSFVDGDLSQFTGPPFNTNPFPANAVGTKVGTLSFTMANNETATLTYSVNGVAVTKTVTRFPF